MPSLAGDAAAPCFPLSASPPALSFFPLPLIRPLMPSSILLPTAFSVAFLALSFNFSRTLCPLIGAHHNATRVRIAIVLFMIWMVLFICVAFGIVLSSRPSDSHSRKGDNTSLCKENVSRQQNHHTNMWFWEGGDCGEVIFTVKRKISPTRNGNYIQNCDCMLKQKAPAFLQVLDLKGGPCRA